MTKIANRSALAAALRAQAVVLRAIGDALESEPANGESEYIDQHSSPLSKRVYLQHAKDRAFPTFKVGRRVVVRREDFEAFLATHERKRPGPRPVPGVSVDDQVLDELGVRRVAGGER